MSNRIRAASAFVAITPWLLAGAATAAVIDAPWYDSVDIVMDEVLLPAATFSAPAQHQMSEWNTVDTTNNSHPFLINVDPQFSFGALDEENTMGFIGSAGLMSMYNVSFTNPVPALAVTASFENGSNRTIECDVMFDVSQPWTVAPDKKEWFQSSAIHELGHCRGLDHWNTSLSMQNTGYDMRIRNHALYMDDRWGARDMATTVSETDMVIYNKWHDGSEGQWMTIDSTTVQEGDVIGVRNVTVENRGTEALAPMDIGFYMSDNETISTSDEVLAQAGWKIFPTRASSTFDWFAIVPKVEACGVKYIGAVIDNTEIHTERWETNNAVTFVDGDPFTGSSFSPTPIWVNLAEDAYEDNDVLSNAADISLGFYDTDLTMERDGDDDYYRFVVRQDVNLIATIASSETHGNLDLELLSQSGQMIASSTNSTNVEQVRETLGKGVYYIRVYSKGASSCNHYAMSVADDQSSCGLGAELALVIPGLVFARRSAWWARRDRGSASR